MDKAIQCILNKWIAERAIEEEKIEVYRFGLECIFLETLHLISYFLIGLCMGEVVSLAISLVVLILMRKKAGGCHAKTRRGCYFASCCIVFLICILNKNPIPAVAAIVGVVISDILILLFAPVENENRELDADEKIRFRKQSLCYLLIVNVVIVVLVLSHKFTAIAYYLGNGLMMTGALMFPAVKIKRRCS